MKIRITAAAAVALAFSVVPLQHAVAAPATLYVAPTGADTGACTQHAPCANIDYAISQAPSGGTVQVAPGFYHQIIVINKPLTLLGAGTNTVVDGWGLDPYSDPALAPNSFYGNVYIGGAGGDYGPTAIGGNVTVSGFTFQNPNPDAITSGEPMLIAVQDAGSGDVITISHNRLLEGTADAAAATDFPIGIDTFVSRATLVADHNDLAGFFQGMLLEDNGPSVLSHNNLSGMIANSDQDGTYPAEGIFLLSDLTPPMTNQMVDHNSFSGYAGYGIALAAGYSNANGVFTSGVSNVTFDHNQFDLGGADGASAIRVHVENDSTLSGLVLSHNEGQVQSPTQAIVIKVDPDGSTLTGLVNDHNNITVH